MSEFDDDFKKTVALLEDKNITQNAKLELVLDFCNEYPYFDMNKFDRYY